MVKFGLVHRSAMNVRAVPPCAGEDAHTTAGETPALRSLARGHGIEIKSSCFRQLPRRWRYNHRPNLTVTLDPAATCEPAGGDCSRAMPLPTASKSRPLSSAISIAERTLLPANDGTTIPPCSTSRTTVPSAGVSGELVRAPTDTLVSVVAEEDASRSRIAAGITAALAIAGLGLTGAIGDLVSGVLASAASRLSPSRSGEPSARS